MTPRRRLRTRYEPEESAEDTPPPQIEAVAEFIPTALEPPSTAEPRTHEPGLEETRPARTAPIPAGASIVETSAAVAEAMTIAATERVPVAPSAVAVETFPPRPHRLAALAFLAGLGLLAFVTGLLLFNSLVMPRLIHGIGQVEVPDVRNLTLDQAEQALRGANLQLSRAGERFDPSVPRGFILSQDPAADTQVRGGKRVSVVLSLGEEFSSVPELSGESQRSAEQLIRSAGLRLGAITRAPSEDVGEGLVAGSDPGPESVMPQGSPVSLLISTGAGEESFVMPDLLGREIAGVRRQLEALGFRVSTPPGTASLGTIVSQRPAAGSRITRATEVQLQATGRLIR